MSTPSPTLLSGVAQAVLEELAEYRYLTVDQMLTLGVAKDRGHLGKVLASLQRPPAQTAPGTRRPREIGALDFGVKVGKGRLPRLYYLTPKGAALLAEADPYYQDLYVPERVTFFAADYEHRVGTIDLHIALRLWESHHNGHELTRMRRYFDWSRERQGKHPVPLTRLVVRGGTITPDMIFSLQDSEGTTRQYCLEFANGRDTKRVTKQLHAYAAALETETLNKALGIPAGIAVRVLFVFASPAVLERVRARAEHSALISEYAPHFYFKERVDCTAELFASDWTGLPDTQYTRQVWE